MVRGRRVGVNVVELEGAGACTVEELEGWG